MSFGSGNASKVIGVMPGADNFKEFPSMDGSIRDNCGIILWVIIDPLEFEMAQCLHNIYRKTKTKQIAHILKNTVCL